MAKLACFTHGIKQIKSSLHDQVLELHQRVSECIPSPTSY